jgi:hypothetical protein
MTLMGRAAMHHYRGRLLQGDKVCLDPANVYIDFDATGAGTASGWTGYLLVGSDQDVVPGETYALQLVDGRSGELRIDSFAPDDSDKVRALFVGQGPMK